MICTSFAHPWHTLTQSKFHCGGSCLDWVGRLYLDVSWYIGKFGGVNSMEGWLESNFEQDVGPSEPSRLDLAHKVNPLITQQKLNPAWLNWWVYFVCYHMKTCSHYRNGDFTITSNFLFRLIESFSAGREVGRTTIPYGSILIQVILLTEQGWLGSCYLYWVSMAKPNFF